MKIFFLGTGSAEGYPSPFCECENCREARKAGGKSFRQRSSIMIDDKLLFDFGPDLVGYTLKYNLCLSSIKVLLITHSHYDHFYPENLKLLLPETGTILTDPPALKIICSQDVADRISNTCRDIKSAVPWEIIIADAYKTVTTLGFEITALPAAHMVGKEKAFFYMVRSKEKTLLCAYDTGKWNEEGWEYLKGHHFHGVIIDETMGYESYGEHHNIEEVIVVKNRMTRDGLIDNKTAFIITHISHNLNPVHRRLEELFAPESIQVAYDGLEVII